LRVVRENYSRVDPIINVERRLDNNDDTIIIVWYDIILYEFFVISLFVITYVPTTYDYYYTARSPCIERLTSPETPKDFVSFLVFIIISFWLLNKPPIITDEVWRLSHLAIETTVTVTTLHCLQLFLYSKVMISHPPLVTPTPPHTCGLNIIINHHRERLTILLFDRYCKIFQRLIIICRA